MKLIRDLKRDCTEGKLTHQPSLILLTKCGKKLHAVSPFYNNFVFTLNSLYSDQQLLQKVLTKRVVMAEILLSEEEKYYLVIGVAEDVRVDGRTRLDYRSGDLEMEVVSNSHSSIRIRLAETDIIIAAKVDLGTPSQENPDQGTINFLVDCSPTASPDFEGRGGDELADTICRILSSAYVKSGTIDLKSLFIVPGYCHVIGVDILVLQCGGNLLDVIAMGVKSCLGICEIPIVTGTRYDLGKPTPIFTNDEYRFKYLDVSEAPVVITLPRVGRFFVIDATLEEESCSKGKLAVGVSPKGLVTSVDKLGKGCYQTRSIAASVQMAVKVGIILNKILAEKIESLKGSKLWCGIDQNVDIAMES